MSTNVSMETLVSLCKRRGFIYQSSEIYGGLAFIDHAGATDLQRHIQEPRLGLDLFLFTTDVGNNVAEDVQ